MMQSCIFAARRILKQKPPEIFPIRTTPDSPDNPAVLKELSRWYVDLEIICPFLSKGICTIYEQRPLACREHLVTGSPLGCMGYSGVAMRVAIPVRMVEVLGQLAGELEGTGIETMILPLIPVWRTLNPNRQERKWTAAMMVERFVEITKSMLSVTQS